jgi:uncharacterized protein (UPF0216 family)
MGRSKVEIADRRRSGEMPERPSISDESIMMRWMQLELRKINEAIVVERKTLTQLCKEVTPSAKTKGGGDHLFDRVVLQKLDEEIPSGLRDRLRIPILFYLDMDVPDSGYLSDEIAVQALQGLGEISLLRTSREGKVWVSRPIIYAMMRKYPTIIQIVMG